MPPNPARYLDGMTCYSDVLAANGWKVALLEKGRNPYPTLGAATLRGSLYGNDEIKWRRWSEWGTFPSDDISRTKGSAKAHRDKKWGEARWNTPPSWPWCLDETELGTADFRAIKHNIYEAALLSPDGSGISAHANADAHFRATLAPGGVAAHLLWRCPLGQVPLKSNDHLQERFAIVLRTTR